MINVGAVVRAVAFSPDGTYLAVAHDSAPFVKIYKRSGTTYSLLSGALVSALPAGVMGAALAWSPDGLYLAVGHGERTSPAPAYRTLTVLKRTDDSFAWNTVTSIDYQPIGIGLTQDLQFSPDGSRLLASTNSTYAWQSLSLYRRSGDSFIRTAQPSESGTSRYCRFTSDGSRILASQIGSPFFRAWNVDGAGAMAVVNDLLDVFPSTHSRCIAVWPQTIPGQG